MDTIGNMDTISNLDTISTELSSAKSQSTWPRTHINKMTILRETMRRYTLDPYTIRVWRQVEGYDPALPGPDDDVRTFLRGQEYDTLILAKTILSLPRVNAVEIVDQHGNGDVFYRSEEVEIEGRKFQII